MKKLTQYAAWLGSGLLTLSMTAPSSAQTAGETLLRTTVISVKPNASSKVFGLSVGNATSVALDGTYFITPNLGLNVLATFFKTEVSAKGLGSLGSVNLLPPIFSLHYHFLPQESIRPYAGVGFNYNRFFGYSGTLSTINTRIENKVGFVATVGADFVLTKSLSLNVDLKYLQVKPEVRTSLGNDTLDLRATILGVGVGYRF